MRVERCTDLRLCHAVLRRSPFVDQALLRRRRADGLGALEPVTPTDPALFPLDDPADRLDPVAEPRASRRRVAASPQRGRLGLLLAAESSGALVAAEMTARRAAVAGRRARAAAHRAARPPAGRRAAPRRRSSGWPAEIRAALRGARA